MKQLTNTLLLLLLVAGICTVGVPGNARAQENGKGDLEDFADDFGEEESDSNSDSDEAVSFFLWALVENMGDVVRLWGGTPATEFGPYPSFPYSAGPGFMALSDDFRSYFFTTEFSYHHLNGDLRSYILKWETQFVHRGKLSFDLAVYEEDRFDPLNGGFKDRLTYYGVRYGYAVFRTPQIILNLEGGFRGFRRNTGHGGPELAVDLQLFPRKPLIIETELAAAYLGNGWLYTAESSIGVLIGRFELLGGIRILKNQSSDLLDGFRVGLRLWY